MYIVKVQGISLANMVSFYDVLLGYLGNANKQLPSHQTSIFLCLPNTKSYCSYILQISYISS